MNAPPRAVDLGLIGCRMCGLVCRNVPGNVKLDGDGVDDAMACPRCGSTLRRRKTDPGIASELPPKTKTDQVVALTQEQVDDFRLVHKVTISPMKDKKAKPTKPSRVDLEASLVDAKAALDAANAGSDLGAQAAAQKAFDEAEKALLKLTREIVLDVKASEATVEEAKAFFDAQEIVEIICTVGFYMTIARLTETTGIDVDTVRVPTFQKIR